MGNLGITTVVFTIDIQAPIVTITSPTAITYGTNSVTISYSVSDGTVVLYQDDTDNSTNLSSGSSWTSLSHAIHNLTITSVDAVGNLGVSTVIFSVDLQAPIISITSPIAITYGTNSVTMVYSVSDGATLVYQDNTANSTNMASGSSWTSLSHGIHNLTITSVDAVGNFGVSTVIFSVDLQAPIISITSPTAITYGINSVTISYSVSDGTVVIYQDNMANSTAFASGSSWSSLSHGIHNLTITSVDAVSNLGITTIIFSVDLQAPVVMITSPIATTYGTNLVIITYSVSDGTVRIYQDDTANSTLVASGSSWTSLSHGTHNVTLTSQDQVGNLGITTVIFIVDLQGPLITITSPTAITYGINSVTISYSVSDGTVLVYQDNVVNSSNIASGYSWVSLSNGIHNLTITAEDAIGNLGATTVLFSIDIEAPVVTITSPTAILYGMNSVTISYSVSDGTVVVYQDDTANSTDIGSGSTWTALSHGTHNLTITSEDGEGNLGIATVIFTVDIQAPLVTILSPTTIAYGINSVTMTYSVSDGTVVVYQDDSANSTTIASGTSWTSLSHGIHNLTITSEDVVGNLGMMTVVFSVDIEAPIVTITSPTAITYGSSSVTISYSVSDGTVLVFLDDNANSTAIASGSSWTSLSHGMHNLTIISQDGVGNLGITTVIFSIDLQAPVLIITSPSAMTYGVNSVTISYSVSDGSVVVYQDENANSTNIPSGSSWTSLSHGTHNLTITAVDEVGNLGIITVIFSIDLQAPIIIITSPTSIVYGMNSVTISYSVSDGSVVVYQDDNSNSTTIPSGSSWISLNHATHNLTITSVDTVGNLGITTVIFSVDLQAPLVTITSPMAITYGSNSVTISYSVSDGTVLLYQDGTVNSTAIASGSSWTPLSHGTHNLTLISQDQVGNLGMTTVIFNVDLQAPVVIITSPLSITYGIDEVTISYSVSDGTVLIYRDDTVNSTNILSDSSWTSLSHGTHNLTITAEDAIGNLGITTVIFSIDLETPVITITSPSPIVYGTNSVIIWYSVSEGTVIVYRDGASNLTNFPSGSSWTSLSHGTHNLTITSEDVDTNLGITTVIFSIDIQAPIITITSPIATTYGINSITLSYSVSEGTVLIYQDTIANVTNILSGSSWNTVSEGSHNLTITSQDQVGNLAKTTVIFSINLATSQLTILSPKAIAYNINEIEIQYFNSNGTITVYLDNIANTSSINSGYIWTDLANAIHNLTIKLVDEFNNDLVETVIFNVDIINPTIDFNTSPMAINTNSFNLEYNISEGEGSYTVNIYIDGIVNNTNLESGSEIFLSEGIHNITIQVIDEAGNNSIESIQITVMFPTPVITMISHENGDFAHFSSALMFNITEDLDTVFYTWDGDSSNTTISRFDGSIYTVIVPDYNGVNHITIYAISLLGKISAKTYLIIITGDGPQISIEVIPFESNGLALSLLGDEAENMNLGDLLNLTVVDQYNPIIYVSYAYTGTNITFEDLNTQNFNQLINISRAGSYEFTIVAINNLGQKISVLVNIIVFGKGPRIDPVNVEGNPINGSSVGPNTLFSFVVSDENSKIESVFYNWNGGNNISLYTGNGLSLNGETLEFVIRLPETLGFSNLAIFSFNELGQQKVSFFIFYIEAFNIESERSSSLFITYLIYFGYFLLILLLIWALFFIIGFIRGDDEEDEDAEYQILDIQQSEEERLNQDEIDADKLQTQKLEFERREKKRFEDYRLLAEKLEVERLKQERLQSDKLQVDQLDLEKLHKRLEIDILDAEKIEDARLEQEQLEADTPQAGKLKLERREKDTLENSKLEEEKLKLKRIEQERIEVDPKEAEKTEPEKLEPARNDYSSEYDPRKFGKLMNAHLFVDDTDMITFLIKHAIAEENFDTDDVFEVIKGGIMFHFENLINKELYNIDSISESVRRGIVNGLVILSERNPIKNIEEFNKIITVDNEILTTKLYLLLQEA